MKLILAFALVMIVVDGRVINLDKKENVRIKRDVIESGMSVMETGINSAADVIKQGMDKGAEMFTTYVKVPENISKTAIEKGTEMATKMAETAAKPVEKAIEMFGSIFSV